MSFSSLFKKKTLLYLFLSILFIAVIILIVLKSYNSENKITQNQYQTTIQPTITTTIYREKAKVAKVFDGDTILLTDGRHVRYLGIDTPEMEKDESPSQCFATEAKHVNEQLVENQEIEMEKDQEDKDKYDRFLRYVWTDDVFVNDFLLRQGFARFDVFPTNTRYAEVFREAVDEARRGKRGLWKACQP